MALDTSGYEYRGSNPDPKAKDFAHRIEGAFPMAGDTAWFAVSLYHGVYAQDPYGGWGRVAASPRAAYVYRVLFRVTPPAAELVTIVPDTAVFWIGMSEDGKEKVMAVGRDSVWDDGGLDRTLLLDCRLTWSRPRFSSVSGQQLFDSTAARRTVSGQPEACDADESGSAVDRDGVGAGGIAPRVVLPVSPISQMFSIPFPDEKSRKRIQGPPPRR